MKEFCVFYRLVICRKLFYLPIVLFAIVGYSFSIYNRTIGVDDFTRNINIGSGNRMLSGRWGMILWNKIVGMSVALDPFIDRFLTLLFLIFAAILFCYILYVIGGNKKVIIYTIAASTYVTYPLINSIWGYTGADFMLSGNLCLVTLAAIVLMCINPFGKRVLYASVLLLLPVSSYESAIFYYASLFCVIVFYEYYAGVDKNISFPGWLKKAALYILPVIIAIIARFAISFVINTIYDLHYSSGGSTAILWLNNSFSHILKCVIAFNFVKYVLMGLVYFPLSVFVVLLVLLGELCLHLSYRKKSLIPAMLGGFLVLSLYSQSFLQGMELEYRNAQTITLFVSFSSFLLCFSITNERMKRLVCFTFLALCWYQAVYLNRILGLNNLRSNNEIALIHQIGTRLSSEFVKKPVAFVGNYQIGDHISKQISVDESSWNGRLFYSIYDRFISKLDRPYFYGANVNSVFGHYQLQECFNYFGYDVDVVLPSDLAKLDVYPKKYVKTGDIILQNAASLVKEKGIKPYQVYDAGNYLIVYLGGAL